ncbi:MAG: hypothetical protein JWQ19_3689 [Subtercola sp.]|nr:hypothetical protein [Subtercola sp.]
MTDQWAPAELAHLNAADELEIAAQRADGTLRAFTPIWVVCVGDQAYLRTWHRRDTGWFGAAVSSQRARVRVPGLEREVAVVDIGGADLELRAQIDAAYGAKYARYGHTTIQQMTGDDAADTTLRITARDDG